MPIRVVLLGDHAATLHALMASLPTDLDLQVVGVHGERQSAERSLREDTPDAALVSARMNDGSGFAMIASMTPADRPTGIVFLSGRERDAVRAFELQATDFVSTPVRANRLHDAMTRVRHRVVQAAMLRTTVELQRLLGAAAAGDSPRDSGNEASPAWRVRNVGERAEGIPSAGPQAVADPSSVLDLASIASISEGLTPAPRDRRTPVSRILVRAGRRTHVVPLATVDWFEADGNYVVVHAGSELYRTRGTLAAIESALDARQFARIHRRVVVNMDRVQEMTSLPSGDGQLRLGSGLQLRLSRTYRGRVR